MGIFDKKYLSADVLRGFDSYRYCCIDNSPLSVYISHPFWNWFVQFYPEWLAPNVITLAGASLVMGCYFLVSYIDPGLTANSISSPEEKWLPAWLWLFCSACTFLAHLLDGTDGKQARRTGASGPTGELFDHGLDSWSTVPFTLTLFSIFGQGAFSVSPIRLLGALITVQLVFIVTHWEKYNTGVLFLSWAYDASQYGLSLFYLITFFVGHRFYQFYVFEGVSFANVFEFGFYACCVLSFIMSFYNMYYAYFIDRTGKQRNLYECILPMVSPTLLYASSLYWAASSPTGVINTAPRLYFWTMGVVFSNIAVRLIIAQMSNTRAETLNGMLVVYMVVSFLGVHGILGANELFVLRILAVAFTLAHVHYGVCVVRQLCDHFNIYAFSLSYLKKKRQDGAKVYQLPPNNAKTTMQEL